LREKSGLIPKRLRGFSRKYVKSVKEITIVPDPDGATDA
jgi:hypothetical protein